jgi:hypothetical protein
MMDAEDAIEAEAYAVLDVTELQALARVFQHVPENTKLSDGPVVIIADMSGDGEALATKGGSDEVGELNIQAVVEAEERKPLRAIKQKVKGLLHNHVADRGGWRLTFLYLGSDGFLDPETARAYVGNFRFRVFAFAAS